MQLLSLVLLLMRAKGGFEQLWALTRSGLQGVTTLLCHTAGWNLFAGRAALLNPNSGYLPDDILTVGVSRAAMLMPYVLLLF